MVDLYERVKDFVVDVNHYPYHRTEVIDKVRGITRIYGKDGDNEKINQVLYSKPYYNKGYIKEFILPKYEDCPLCLVGREIVHKTRKISFEKVKTPSIILAVLGLLAIPLVLYSTRKKLTKPET